MLIGYARISITDPRDGIENQEHELRAFGCEVIHSERALPMASGSKLLTVLSGMSAEDVLVATRADRLARNPGELLSIIEWLTSKNAQLVVLSLGKKAFDTRGTMSKATLAILAGVAAWEREIRREYQCEGTAKARRSGMIYGRVPAAMQQAAEVRHLRDDGIKPAEIAGRLGITRASVYRALAATAPISQPVERPDT